MRLHLTKSKFNEDGYWHIPIDKTDLLLRQESVHLFDQNGYQLTPTEIAYANANNHPEFVVVANGCSTKSGWYQKR